MNLVSGQQEVMELARNKNWGVSNLIVSEKMALIHTEISEAYEAFLDNNWDGKDGFHEEVCDVLIRTLHLAGSFNVDVSNSQIIALPTTTEGKLVFLHKIASSAYENYRRKNIESFKGELVHLSMAVIQLSKDLDFSLQESFSKKMSLNMHRTWDKDKYNENLRE
jgi:hypothetical protein